MSLRSCSSLLRSARIISAASNVTHAANQPGGQLSSSSSLQSSLRKSSTPISTSNSSTVSSFRLGSVKANLQPSAPSFAASYASIPTCSTAVGASNTVSSRAFGTGVTEGGDGEEEGEDTIEGLSKKKPPDNAIGANAEDNIIASRASVADLPTNATDAGDDLGGGGVDLQAATESAEESFRPADDEENDDAEGPEEYEDAPEIDEMRLRGLRVAKRALRTEFERTDDLRKLEGQDPQEFLMFAKDAFLKKDEKVITIPPEVRRVMYKYTWDKLLIDTHRHMRRIRFEKVIKMHAMVAVGNMQGLIGLGIGVDGVAQAAVAKAYLDAFSNLVSVPLYRGHTVYHKIEHKFSKINMLIMPRPEGWGFKGSDLMYELSHMVGLKNVSITMLGGRTKNKFFQAHCFVEALKKQTTPYDGVDYTGMYMREVWHRPTLPSGLQRGVEIP